MLAECPNGFELEGGATDPNSPEISWNLADFLRFPQAREAQARSRTRTPIIDMSANVAEGDAARPAWTTTSPSPSA
jgi:hypothetical protein